MIETIGLRVLVKIKFNWEIEKLRALRDSQIMQSKIYEDEGRL